MTKMPKARHMPSAFVSRVIRRECIRMLRLLRMTVSGRAGSDVRRSYGTTTAVVVGTGAVLD